MDTLMPFGGTGRPGDGDRVPGLWGKGGLLRSVRDFWLLEMTRAPDPSVSPSRVWRRLTAAVAVVAR